MLAPVEVEGLLATLRELAASGTTIVIVTHKLDEVRAVADEVTVLRAGKTVATFAARRDARARRPRAIARAMVGADAAAARARESLTPAGRRRADRARARRSVARRRARCAASRSTVRARRDRRRRRRRRQRPARARARDRGARARTRPRADRRARRDARVAGARGSPPGSRTSPRIAITAGSCSTRRVADNLALGRARHHRAVPDRSRARRARSPTTRIAELDIRPAGSATRSCARCRAATSRRS